MAGEIISSLINIGKLIWDPIKCHASYIFCYVQNIDALGAEATELEQKVNEFKQDMDEACRRGDIIRDEVDQWLKKADNMISEAQRVVNRSTNTKCWKGSCYNPVLCYGLGKEAAEKILSIGQLRNKGNFQWVSRPPPLPSIESLLPNRDFQALPSTEEPMKHVLDVLKDDGINIIGVHGMGGVGKTTLMKEVAKQAKRELFDEVVMVTVSQNVFTSRMQKEIGEKLGFELKDETESVRAARLSAKLKRVGKLLIILDDLWDRLDLSVVGIPYGDEHRGCKIVLTSRSSDVCGRMGSQRNILVKPLHDEESWTLFKTFVGDAVNSNDLFEVARHVVRECKGLPLAIKVLGLALRNKNDITVWNVVLRRLRNSIPTDIQGMEKEVFEVIKYSFDHLGSEEAKLCFLFCCLYQEDGNISPDDITWYMVGEGLMKLTETLDEAKEEVSFYIDNLKASGLLLEGSSKGWVKMHDIVRDVAIWIAEKIYRFYSKPRVGLKEWPKNIKAEECQRLSLMENEINILPNERLWYPNLHTLLLAGNHNLKMIPDSFFSEMKALKVVDICSTQISSFPTSLLGLTNLRVLDVRGCIKLMHLSGIGTLKSLEILYLSNLVQTNVLPIELGELCKLRLLDLSETNCMIPCNVISQLSSLEQLYMENGFDKWQAQGSEGISCAAFAELASLSRLTTLRVNVGDERCLAQDLGHGCFEKLRSFRIRHTSDAFLRKANNILTITGSVVPDWGKPLLGRADGLVLLRCTGGVDISISTFYNIKALGLYGIDDLTQPYHRELPYGSLSKLKELIIEEWHKLINVSSSGLISSAHQLEELQVRRCDQLSHVFYYDNALGGTSHNSILLPHLEELELISLPQLTSLCEGDVPPQSLASLKRLVIRECNSLKHILSPTSAVVLEQLGELEVHRCDHISHVFHYDNALGGARHNPISLPHLKKLELISLPQLTSLCEGDVPPQSLASLKWLVIRECNSLKHILSPTSAVVLEQLELLDIWDCKQLEKLFSSDLPGQSFLRVKELYIRNCDSLVSLFSWRQVRSLGLLEWFSVRGCQSMASIIMSEEEISEKQVIKDNTNVLPRLKYFDLIDLQIASFDKEGFYKFDWPSLEIIHIKGCPNLKKLPLSSQGAPKLRRINGSEEWFQALQWSNETSKSRLQTLFHPIHMSMG